MAAASQTHASAPLLQQQPLHPSFPSRQHSAHPPRIAVLGNLDTNLAHTFLCISLRRCSGTAGGTAHRFQLLIRDPQVEPVIAVVMSLWIAGTHTLERTDQRQLCRTIRALHRIVLQSRRRHYRKLAFHWWRPARRVIGWFNLLVGERRWALLKQRQITDRSQFKSVPRRSSLASLSHSSGRQIKLVIWLVVLVKVASTVTLTHKPFSKLPSPN